MIESLTQTLDLLTEILERLRRLVGKHVCALGKAILSERLDLVDSRFQRFILLQCIPIRLVIDVAGLVAKAKGLGVFPRIRRLLEFRRHLFDRESI